MSSSLEYIEYVCTQIEGITYKKMFGEYTIYCQGKILGLVCDNQVFIKPTKAIDRFIENPVMQAPYVGAKPHLLLEDLEDRDFLRDLIAAVIDELPLPKVKKSKRPTHE